MKKFFAIILAIITLFSVVTLSAFADGEEPATEPTEQTEQTGTEEPQTPVTPKLGAGTEGVATISSDAPKDVEAVVVVDVEWGPALTPEFHFAQKKYNPETHKYETTEAYWSGRTETWVKVINHSNVKIVSSLKVDCLNKECENVGIAVGTRDNNTVRVNWGRAIESEIGSAVRQTDASSYTHNYFIRVVPSVQYSYLTEPVGENTDLCKFTVSFQASNTVDE